MSFLRFPMFQHGGNVVPAMSPPGARPPLPGTRRVYHSDSPDGPWEEVKEGLAFKCCVLYTPQPPSQPAPAPLWKQMQEAYNSANATAYAFGGCDGAVTQGYAAEIEAVAEWLELSCANLITGGNIERRVLRLDERKRLCNLLKEQARLAREGNA